MTEKPRRKGQFQPGQSGNTRGRISGSERLRRHLKPHEVELVAKALELARDGDTGMVKELLCRFFGHAPKATLPAVKLPAMLEARTLADKADAVLDAVARGEIAPDVAEKIALALQAKARLEESTELAERIAKLEGAVLARGLL